MSGREAMLATLGDMGFGANRAKRAMKATGYRGVEPAMEWLLSNADNDTLDDPVSEDEQPEPEQKTESSDEKLTLKPLTEEEKKEKLAKLEALKLQKRAEREEREKQEALERERKRINDGKDMTEIKLQMEQQEIRKMAEIKRREKQEEKAAKAKILAQIEADKIARREKFNMKGANGGESSSAAAASAPSPAPAAAPSASPAAKKDYSEARIQIRQSNGQPIVHTFGAKESLAAIRLYVEMNRTDGSTGPVKLMTNFPKKIFSDEDYNNSLENLGLVPSAVLMMTK